MPLPLLVIAPVLASETPMSMQGNNVNVHALYKKRTMYFFPQLSNIPCKESNVGN